MKKLLDYTFEGTGDMKGFIFTRITSTDTAYLYEVTSSEGNVHYEVFKRIIVPICVDFKNRVYSDVHTKETYPKTKDFGVLAWNYKLIKSAVEKIKTL